MRNRNVPEKEIESFRVKRLEILRETGEADDALAPPLEEPELQKLYELLVLSRTFDGRALSLQREGRIGTYASILGQEAAQVGSAYALEKTDWIFPSFREMGVYLTMGYPAHLLFQYWAGDERGVRCPDELNIFPVCVPVATQIPHAVGAAMAVQYRGDQRTVVCYFGDGGTSKGDFHEAFNMAGVFRLPVVFICQNNHWAISVPRERQTASRTIAQKAFAYGFEGIQVDGNDVLAVFRTTKHAIQKAKQGDGPTFLEFDTYRMADHTTADDAARYRSKEEVDAWKERDPLLRMRRYLERKGLWSEAFEKEVGERARGIIDEAVKTAEAAGRPDGRDMILYTADLLSPRQKRQLKEL